MAEGPNQQNAMPAVENNEVRNNGPSVNGRSRLLLDVQDLGIDGQSNRDGRNGDVPRPYIGLVKQKTVSLKLKDRHPRPGQLEGYAREFDRKLKLATKRQLGNDGAAVVKTLTFPGCICFSAVIYVTEPTVYFEQDPVALVECLPSDLQHEKIQIATESFCATVENLSVTDILPSRKQSRRQSNGKSGLGLGAPQRVTSIEPPCLQLGMPGQKIEIHMRNESEDDVQTVTEMENKVVDNSITNETVHELNVPCGTEQSRPSCGSVRTMACNESLPRIDGWGIVGRLPADAAAELNAYYAKWVHNLNQSVGNLKDAREHIWSNIIQPLLTDLNFVLTHAQSIQTPSREYGLVLLNILNFLAGERLQSCASFVRRFCGKTGTEAVQAQCMKRMDDCGRLLSHLMNLLHGFEMLRARSLVTDNRFFPTGMLLGLSPVCR